MFDATSGASPFGFMRAGCAGDREAVGFTARYQTFGLHEFLDELDEYVGALPLPLLTELLSRVVITPEEIQDYVQFDPNRYRRNRVRLRAHYEALVLCWRPDQISPIHDHGESNCAVAVISGEAVEIGFAWTADGQLRVVSSQRLCAGSITAAAGPDLHQVANWSHPQRDLVTLHIYSPPLMRMETYPESKVLRVPATRVKGLVSLSARGHRQQAG